MESIEFAYLKNLIKNGKARISISQFFVQKSLSLWVIYKDNQTLLLIYTFFWFVTSEWFWIPFSIFLAWIFHTWWIIIIGIAFCWIIDFIIKILIYYFLPDSIMRDENLLNYFWEQKLGHPTISIQSTKQSRYSLPSYRVPAIMIIPPHPWQEVVNEFEKEY
jgi:hypothetical protein